MDARISTLRGPGLSRRLTMPRGTLPALLAAAAVAAASGVLVAAIGGLATEAYGATLVVAWAHLSLWTLPVLLAGWVLTPPGPDVWSALAERFSAAGIAAQRGFLAVIGLGLVALSGSARSRRT